MIDTRTNPWAEMHSDATRRIDHNSLHDFHWVKDEKSRLGLLVIFKSADHDADLITNINGITVIKRIEKSQLELYLIANNNDDWELFLALCNDLINISETCRRQEDLIKVINNRLRRWQKFLGQGKSFAMTEIQQMGLLTELYFLSHELLKQITLPEAIQSWVGPDFDKQDFSLEYSFVEIKSFIGSKGPFVRISSLYQLNKSSKPLFLMAYSLSKNNAGLTILDLIEQIMNQIADADILLRDEFETKLAQYGFWFNITEAPFYKWLIDRGTLYSVTDNFPKILASDIPAQIVSAEYTIDLSKCIQFETETDTIFMK